MPLREVGLWTPALPVRHHVACEDCVPPSPPSPCGRLSRPPSTTEVIRLPMDHQPPSCRVGWAYLVTRHAWGLPRSPRFSLCLPGPEDPDRPSGLSPCTMPLCGLPVRANRRRLPYGLYEAVPDFRVCGHPSGLQSSLCTLHLVRSGLTLLLAQVQHAVRVVG